MRGIAMRMKNLMPVITDYPQMEVTVANQIMYDELDEIKRRIQVTLANDLNNAQIQFHIKLAEQDKMKPKLTRVEYYNQIAKENPAIALLTKELQLDLA